MRFLRRCVVRTSRLKLLWDLTEHSWLLLDRRMGL